MDFLFSIVEYKHSNERYDLLKFWYDPQLADEGRESILGISLEWFVNNDDEEAKLVEKSYTSVCLTLNDVVAMRNHLNTIIEVEKDRLRIG